MFIQSQKNQKKEAKTKIKKKRKKFPLKEKKMINLCDP